VRGNSYVLCGDSSVLVWKQRCALRGDSCLMYMAKEVCMYSDISVHARWQFAMHGKSSVVCMVTALYCAW
jgi:hypothetical protein